MYRIRLFSQQQPLVTHRLINLTGKEFSMYDTGGNVRTIYRDTYDGDPAHLADEAIVVVGQKDSAQELKINPERVAIIATTGTGNEGKEVSRLELLQGRRTVYYDPNTPKVFSQNS